MHQLPVGWSEYGRDGNNSVTFLRPGHTVQAPRLAIFNRKPPVANGNGFSVPTYRVRLIDGHLDADGVAMRERSILDLTIRQPVDASATAITTSLSALAAMLSDAAFVDDATVDYMFPREAPTTTTA